MGEFIMTLIVSMRTPDGIVLAGDSLTTVLGSSPHRIVFDFACPVCAHEQRIEGIAPIETTVSTWSFARKVFLFYRALVSGQLESDS